MTDPTGPEDQFLVAIMQKVGGLFFCVSICLSLNRQRYSSIEKELFVQKLETGLML